MSRYNRYLFLKRLYKDYIILIRFKNKLISYDIDLLLFKEYGFDKIKQYNINYIVLNNLEIDELGNYDNNKYLYYYKKILIFEIIRKIGGLDGKI